MYSNLRKTLKKAGVVMIAAACLLTTSAVYGASNAAKAPAPGQNYDIVVLGDSLAAGYQKGFTADSVPYGFAEHVYEQALIRGYRANYDNYGILGLRTGPLNKWLSEAAQGKTSTVAGIQPDVVDPRASAILARSAALKEDLTEADLVLVSIGGNDFLAMVEALDASTPFKDLSADKKNALQQDIDQRIQSYKSELNGILNTVHTLQPNAEIVVANQYLPVPFLTFNDTVTYLIDQSTALFLKEGQAKLNSEVSSVVKDLKAQGVNISIADAASAIEKNILGFTSISATGADGKPEPDIHPTEKGYAELGKAYATAVWGSYATLQPRKSGVPISVVVGGKEVVTKYDPLIKQGRTFLALSTVIEALGADLKWDAKSSTATISTGGRTVSITIGASTIIVDGKKVPLNAEPAYLEQFPGEKKTYVPLAALSEGLGFQVVYRASLKAAFINP
ncbi:stalk domain-containing protein [Paenibacillus sp. CAU 1782]